MVKTFTVWTSAGIEGYNPPDYYRTLDSNEAISKFLSEFPTQLGKFTTISIDNELGRIVIPYRQTSNYMGANVILIKVTDTFDNHTYNVYFVGTINSFNVISADALEINYTVDWFTTSILNYYSLGYSFKPTAKTMLARRLTDGEFTYLSENMTPASIDFVKLNPIKAEFTRENRTYTYDLFTSDPQGVSHDISPHMYCLKYHDSGSQGSNKNCDYTFLCYATSNYEYIINPKQIIEYYNEKDGFEDISYNPSGVIFFGECCINSMIMKFMPMRGMYTKEISADPYTAITIQLLDEQVSGTDVRHFDVNISNVKLYCQPPTDHESDYLATDYNKLSILAPNGNEVYSIPRGKSLVDGADALTVNIHLTGPINAPYLYFDITNTSWHKDNTKSFSIPLNMVNFFVDAYEVYLAQEREYSMQMRNLQATNDLVSGVIGGFNQGAMISAFSRTGARTGAQAMDKGIIGGGIAIAGAVAMYGYQTLYANKKATEIEDAYNRNKPDMLAMTGDFPLSLSGKAGLYAYRYDAVTIANIKAYQSAFGYQTNKVFTDKDLSSFVGYVQGDVLLKNQHYSYDVDSTTITHLGGLNTTIAKYIKDMFNYGVYFTKVV